MKNRFVEKTLDWAITQWCKGNVYKYDGSFYIVGTDEYVCPAE